MALQDAHICYQSALIEYYNALMYELAQRDWVFYAQHMHEITDLRAKAQTMRATAFYEYAVPILREMLR